MDTAGRKFRYLVFFPTSTPSRVANALACISLFLVSGCLTIKNESASQPKAVVASPTPTPTPTPTPSPSPTYSLGVVSSPTTAFYSGNSSTEVLKVAIYKNGASDPDSSLGSSVSAQIAAYSDSACSSAFLGTWNSATSTVTFSSGAATFSGFSATLSSSIEQQVYLKVSTSSSGNSGLTLSKCIKGPGVILKFAAGTGYVLINPGDVGIAGATGSSRDDYFRQMALDYKGRIVLWGYSKASGGQLNLGAVARVLADGTLDASYGGQGTGYGALRQGSTTTIGGATSGSRNDYVLGGHVDGQGRIWAGLSSTNTYTGMEPGIFRISENGTLDTSFSSNGWIMLKSVSSGAFCGGAQGTGNQTDWIYSVLPLPQGGYFSFGRGIDAVGSGGYGTEIFSAKYLSTGALDTSFGTNGINCYNNNSAGIDGIPVANRLEIPQKAIVSGNYLYALGTMFSGYSTQNSVNQPWVARYLTSTGAPDTTFGNNGFYVLNPGAPSQDAAPFASKSERIYGGLVDSQNRITVAGVTNNSTLNAEPLIFRLTSAGQLDSSFGTGGVVVLNAGQTSFTGDSSSTKSEWASLYTIENIAASPDGGYYIMIMNLGSTTRGHIVKLTSSGSLDTTWGSSGKVSINSGSTSLGGFASPYDLPQGIAVDSWGRLIVGAYSKTVNGGKMPVVMRFKADGTLDL